MRALFYIIGGVLIAFIITIAVFWPTKHNYPSEVTQSFMNSCQASTGGDQKLCADLLDEIQAKYSFEEFELYEFIELSNQLTFYKTKDQRRLANNRGVL
jgi:hypothetical protein